MGVHGCSEDLQMAGVPYFEPRDAKSSQCFIQHGAKRSGGCEAVPKSIGWNLPTRRLKHQIRAARCCVAIVDLAEASALGMGWTLKIRWVVKKWTNICHKLDPESFGCYFPLCPMAMVALPLPRWCHLVLEDRRNHGIIAGRSIGCASETQKRKPRSVQRRLMMG